MTERLKISVDAIVQEALRRMSAEFAAAEIPVAQPRAPGIKVIMGDFHGPDAYLTIGDARGVDEKPLPVGVIKHVFTAPPNMLAGPASVGLLTGFR